MSGLINPWMPEPNAIVHQALGKLGEEVGELSQIVARCLIQGFTASEPVTLKANRDRIAEEIVDVEAAIQWLKEVTNLGIHEDWVEARRLKKLDGFRRWQAMIREAYAGDDTGKEAPTNEDLAAIGQSVMNWIDELTQQEGPLKDWTPAESPAEIIPDLYNMLEESLACHRQACGEAKTLAAEMEARSELIFPRELTDDLRDVLSMMMWNTGPIAHALRAGGADIPTKAELEQAHVLHWLTLLVLEHHSVWREKGEEKLKEIRATIATAMEGGVNG
ncbi:hypothetical protein [Rhizobium leguminosarum]|uniref:hypothetical protein n=1 Tax=Rhizobium leguminosarum TaxID=384 RepID=UPI001C93FC35|nr:hypothetical protein [Rhizobium leguminosarum]